MTDKQDYTIYKEQRESYIKTGENERNKIDNMLTTVSIALICSSLIYLGVTDSFKHTFFLFLSASCFMVSIIDIILSCKYSELSHRTYVEELDGRWKDKEDIYKPLSSKYDKKISYHNISGEITFGLGVVLMGIFMCLLIK